MTYRTIRLSNYQACLEFEGASLTTDFDLERTARILRFPYTVMLEASFAEFDYANRWCWQLLGPADGECLDSYSEYPSCLKSEPHNHEGRWGSHFLVKTEYNYGFCEWYFSNPADQQSFLDQVPTFHWGEKFPVA
jgi:hypothetical protein